MHRKKLKILITEISLIVIVSILAFTIFNDEYLFGWAIHHKMFSLIITIIPLIILALGYSVISLSTISGIILGLFTGNFLGNTIMKKNISEIVEGMGAEQVSRLQHHPGFEIWMLFIISSFVIGIILHYLTQKNN